MRFQDILIKMKTGGSSVVLTYGEDNNLWECSWITSGQRFTGFSKFLKKSVDLCIKDFQEKTGHKFFDGIEVETETVSIKTVWGGDRPRVIFLTDGTKISIDGNDKNQWLKIGEAAVIVAHSEK